ncbi:MAG: hypothetical protein Q9191_004567 [Dirinaria sp. TL-2023a]
MNSLPSAPIIPFFSLSAAAADTTGRTLSHLLTWNHASLARHHDYIHLLFPLTKPRAAGHPRVDRSVVQEFRTRPELRARLRRAFLLMLGFYGFQYSASVEGVSSHEDQREEEEEEGEEGESREMRLVRTPGYPKPWHAGAGWISAVPNHHHASISRIILSLRLLGLEDDARAFYTALSEPLFARGFDRRCLAGWRRSMEIDLNTLINLEGLPEVQGEEKSGVEDLVKEFSDSVSRTLAPSTAKGNGYSAQLPSWNTDSLPPGLNARPVFGPAVLPSPLGKVETRWTLWRFRLRRRHSELVRAFYERVIGFCSASATRNQIRKRAALFDHTRPSGLVCYLEPSKGFMNITRRSGDQVRSQYAVYRPAFEIVSLPNTIDLPPLVLQPVTSTPKPVEVRVEVLEKSRPSIELLPVQSAATGHVDHFVINRRHRLFRVNGVDVEIYMLAGPLPDFCVIEVDNSVALWWRNIAALDYSPEISEYKSRKRGFDHVDPEQERGTTESVKRRKPDGPSVKLDRSAFSSITKTFMSTRHSRGREHQDLFIRSQHAWKQKLDRGLDRHQKARGKRANEISLSRHKNLTDDDVVNGIAAFWIPLRRQGTIFGFGTVDLFTFCRTQEAQMQYQMTACGTNGPFIMPLLFTMSHREAYENIIAHGHNLRARSNKPTGSRDSRGSRSSANTQEEQGVPIGHLLLVIAEKDPQAPNNITATVFDSSPGQVHPDEIRMTYQSLITYSGWLGVSPDRVPLQNTPSFVLETDAPVARQPPSGGNTCGIYAILAAWAYMLNIPLHQSPERKRRGGFGGSLDFHKKAAEVIDLALAGHMDAETVQAFMNVFGYCVEQDIQAPTPSVRTVDAERLETDLLQNVVRELQDEEIVEAVGRP